LSRQELRSAEICLGCHDEPDSEGDHDSDKVGQNTCVDCHDPHAAERPGFIKPSIE
jgi:predicted CXXCH cytochrome family protein